METRDIDRGEVLRYLGYGRHEADWRVMDLVEQCIEELGREASPLYLCRDYPLALGQEGLVDAGVFITRSRNLAKNLADCGLILVFAARFLLLVMKTPASTRPSCPRARG